MSRGWDIRALGPQRGGGATLPAPRYDVRLPRQRGERADWIALDPSYGRLIGQFVAVDDSISSTFVSSDGRYSGSEWMMLDGGRYLARGVVLHDGDLVCRWALSLSSACPIEMADIRCVAQGSQERFFAGNGAALGQ